MAIIKYGLGGKNGAGKTDSVKPKRSKSRICMVMSLEESCLTFWKKNIQRCITGKHLHQHHLHPLELLHQGTYIFGGFGQQEHQLKSTKSMLEGLTLSTECRQCHKSHLFKGSQNLRISITRQAMIVTWWDYMKDIQMDMFFCQATLSITQEQQATFQGSATSHKSCNPTHSKWPSPPWDWTSLTTWEVFTGN